MMRESHCLVSRRVIHSGVSLLTSTLRLFLPIFLGAVLLAPLAGPASAQARPSPAQAEALLRARPELVEQLQQRIAGSGLTPEQVRARLRAEGYPEGLLDAYLGGGAGAGAVANRDVIDAVRALGLVDDTDLEELTQLAGLSPSTTRPRVPSADPLTPPDSGMSIFGLSLFRGATSLFLPNLDGPVDAGYQLGPGDQLVLILTGDVELAHTLDVTREGFVVIPQVGQIGVANLTLGELEDLLYTRLGRAYSGVRRGANATTRFSVSVSRLRSNQVFVAGDVVNPGSYRVTSAGTALTALYAAGGPTELGSMRRVEVRRGGSLVSALDVYDYLLRGDGSRDVRLQQGDVVFVPPHGRRARVVGAIARPAIYELKDGETMTDLVRAAGGLLARADGRRVVIERILAVADRDPGRARAIVDVPLGVNGSVPAMAVEDGDVVSVPAIGDRVRSRILVRGHVWSEGEQGYTPGLTLSEALSRAGGLKSDAYLGTVHVSRLRADSTRLQLRAMLRDTTGATFEPLALQEDDEITVYSRTTFRPERFVAISGAVRGGGRFPWRAGMTLRDLVLMAGGLEMNAYLGEAEVARIPADGDPAVVTVSIRVSLDSSYHFDGGADAVRQHPEVPLEPFDNVLILRDPTWSEPRSVLVFGEVRFPGRYTLRGRADRLSDVVRRAGGLTAYADPDGAYFTRLVDTASTARVESTERRRAATSANDLAETMIDSATLSKALDGVGSRIRVGVDFREALRARNRSDDLILVAGDSIFVPALRQTVEVRGAVNAPTALAHGGGRLESYIAAAGGTTERARVRRAYVIQPNGKIESRRQLLWLFNLDPEPRPGATVVVPAKGEQVQSGNALATLSVVTQMLASLAAIVALSR